jgi:hypothetical protein
MTESNHTLQCVTLVAVDIAKHYHDVLIEPPTPKRRSRLRLANHLEDFERLADYLRGLKVQCWSVLRRPATIIGRWRVFSTARVSSCG